MKLNELKPNDGAVRDRKRVGRGISSGTGKTCGVGQKGQKSRTGVAINGFEGGQTPLCRRLPKRGFNPLNPKDYAELSLIRLQRAIDAKKIDTKKELTEEALVASGVVRRVKDGVRLIGTSDFKSKVNLKISGGVTKGALEAVEKAGGSVTVERFVPAPVKKRGEKKA